MHRLTKVYLAAGTTFILSIYVIMLSIWFEATVNGSLTGQYVVAINTNALGENYVELALLFLFLPVATWVFTRGIRRLLRSEEVV